VNIQNTTDSDLKALTDEILKDYDNGRDIDRMQLFNKPDMEVIADVISKLLNITFPGYYYEKTYRSTSVANRMVLLIEDIFYNLRSQMEIALPSGEQYRGMSDEEIRETADRLCREYMRKIPAIRAAVDTDLQATFDGDPAACGKDEVILSYPGIMASTIYRHAHELFVLQVPLIPRMMTEYAHSRSGIDIHPGATIGNYLCMDHGTGIVIGETAVIGEHVKIYQGVTLGGLSTRGGQSLRGKRRHPTIEDNVTIYAGASILGGETVIGHGSVVGSNVFITSSIPADTRISNKTQEYAIRKKGEKFSEEPVATKENDNWFANT